MGAGMQNVVRVTYVLPNAADFPDCWPTLRKYFGEVKPAAMMISSGLSDPHMRIEIEEQLATILKLDMNQVSGLADHS